MEAQLRMRGMSSSSSSAVKGRGCSAEKGIHSGEVVVESWKMHQGNTGATILDLGRSSSLGGERRLHVRWPKREHCDELTIRQCAHGGQHVRIWPARCGIGCHSKAASPPAPALPQLYSLAHPAALSPRKRVTSRHANNANLYHNSSCTRSCPHFAFITKRALFRTPSSGCVPTYSGTLVICVTLPELHEGGPQVPHDSVKLHVEKKLACLW
jgi:hypothetical protein